MSQKNSLNHQATLVQAKPSANGNIDKFYPSIGQSQNHERRYP